MQEAPAPKIENIIEWMWKIKHKSVQWMKSYMHDCKEKRVETLQSPEMALLQQYEENSESFNRKCNNSVLRQRGLNFPVPMAVLCWDELLGQKKNSFRSIRQSLWRKCWTKLILWRNHSITYPTLDYLMAGNIFLIKISLWFFIYGKVLISFCSSNGSHRGPGYNGV